MRSETFLQRWSTRLALTTFVVVTGFGCLGSTDGASPEARKPASAAPAPTDRYGDSLPAGALARLGTVRFRDGATAIAYSPNGKLLASGGADNHIRLFDVATGKVVRQLTGHLARTFSAQDNPRSAFPLLVDSVGPGHVTTLAFSPDGQTLASGGWDDTVRLWNVATGKERRRVTAHLGMVAAVAFSPNGKLLASRGGLDGTLRLWDPETGVELRRIDSLSRVNPWRFYREAALVFAPDSKTVAGTTRKAIVFYDVATGKPARQLDGYRDCMYLAYSPDGKLLASGGLDDVKKEQYSLRIWDGGTGQELRRCVLPKNEPPTCFAFSPDSRHLVAAVAETDTFLFDVQTGKVLHRLPHYWAFRVAFAPDGKTVASIRGQTIRFWDPKTGKELFLEFQGHQRSVSSVAVSSDGKLVATAGENIRLWNPATGKQLLEIGSPATALSFSPDGLSLASVDSGHREVHVWDAATSKEIFKLDGPRLQRAVAFSPNGKVLAAGDEQGTVRWWEVATRKLVHEIDLKSGAENLTLAFSPDNKTLACAGGWNEGGIPPGITLNLQRRVTITGKRGFFVLQWDVASSKEIHRFGGLTDNIKSLAFSPDGKILAAASRDGRIALWEAATGRELLYIMAHPNHTDAAFTCSPSLAFSPDGKTLASASTDRTVRLWDVTTAKERARIQGDAAFYAVGFGRGGKTLLTGGADTAVMVWDLEHPAKPPAKPHTIILR
jgi:WD40 repeat protein